MSVKAESKTLEQRKQKRVSIPEHPEVLDAHSSETLGQLVNLSVEGLMLMGTRCIGCGTICQMRIALVQDEKTVEIQVGVESLWCEDANDSGAHWTGFQIIDISPQHREILKAIVGD